jgi:hypothetical protein
MTEPSSQHLYVMQNEFGCIKVGRSVDPWQRRLNLRQTEHCRVELIAAFEGGGEDEEAIHVELDAFRLEGEWFDGGEAARGSIQRIFGLEPLEWKYAHDVSGAAEWLNHLRVVRGANYIRNAITREIGLLRRATEASWVYDGAIFSCCHLAKTGDRAWVVVEKRGGETVNIWSNSDTGKQEISPAYTASLTAALLAWPAELRPADWSGSPIECCTAALVALRAQLPNIKRR